MSASAASVRIFTACCGRFRFSFRFGFGVGLVEGEVHRLAEFAEVVSGIKQYPSLFDARGGEFFFGLGGCSGFDGHAEVSQVAQLHDVPFAQHVQYFEKEFAYAAFKFSLRVRRPFGDAFADVFDADFAATSRHGVELGGFLRFLQVFTGYDNVILHNDLFLVKHGF